MQDDMQEKAIVLLVNVRKLVNLIFTTISVRNIAFMDVCDDLCIENGTKTDND